MKLINKLFLSRLIIKSLNVQSDTIKKYLSTDKSTKLATFKKIFLFS